MARLVLAASVSLSFGALLHGCYDSCDREGAVRCRGTKVEQCGYFPGEQMSWDEAADCGPRGVCSVEEPQALAEANCVMPDVRCETAPATLCVDDVLLRCDRVGAPARWHLACLHGCEASGDDAYCRPSPAPDAG